MSASTADDNTDQDVDTPVDTSLKDAANTVTEIHGTDPDTTGQSQQRYDFPTGGYKFGE